MEIKQKYIDIKTKNIADYIDKKAIYGLIRRVAGTNYCNKIILEPQKSDGFDFYEVSDKEGKICIRANTGVSFAKGFNAYLKECCHYSVGALSTSGTLPAEPPPVKKTLKNKSAFLYRYFFNYCTFCYTYAFDTWKDWEKTLDYLLLSGYNLILNPIGIESVWKNVLTRTGYTKKDINDFLCGPAFYAWQWMMNLSGWAGGAPDWWYDFRAELSGKINQRLQSFGAAVVNAGYVGMVPDNFCKYFPESKIALQGKWFGYRRPGFLLPDDPNYEKMSDLYYSELKKIKGGKNVRYFSADPFHEGGIRDGIDIEAFSLANYNKMQQHSPDSVWVLQEWGEPKPEIIRSIPDGGILMLSLSADQKNPDEPDITGCPWCYCAVNYFGGQYYLHGAAKEELLNPFRHLENNTSKIVGIGYMPESVNCGEIIYSVFSENAYSSKRNDIDEFLNKYMLERYGKADKKIYPHLRNIFDCVFSKNGNCGGESGLCSRPSLDVCRVSSWSREALPYLDQSYITAYTEAMLSCYDEMQSYGGYKNDLLESARQLVNNLSWYFIEKIKESYHKKDINTLSSYGKELLSLFDLQSDLMATDKNHMLGTWLEKAKKLGKTDAEKSYFEWNARVLITLWGQKGEAADWLRDYAAREWHGMLTDFYKPRWERFISRLELSLLTGKKFLPANDYNEEVAFTFEKKKYPSKPSGSLKKATQNILNKVKSVKIDYRSYNADSVTFEQSVLNDINKE